MADIAYKPISPVPKGISPAILDDTTRTELVYRFGEDISRWGVIAPFTKNHTQKYNLLAMFDGIASSSYHLSSTSASTLTTTIIVDFGRLLEVRGAIISFALFSATSGTARVKTYFSEDRLNYQEIGDDISTTPYGVDYYFDHVAAMSKIRDLKIEIITTGGAASTKTAKLYQAMIIV